MRRTISTALVSLALAACEAAPLANAPGDGTTTGTPAAGADSGTSGGSVVTSPDGGILVTGGGTGAATPDAGLALTTDAGVACAPEACPGPAPLSPSVLCLDNSVAGPRCVALDDAGCAWRILVCPPPPAVPAGGGPDAG